MRLVQAEFKAGNVSIMLLSQKRQPHDVFLSQKAGNVPKVSSHKTTRTIKRANAHGELNMTPFVSKKNLPAVAVTAVLGGTALAPIDAMAQTPAAGVTQTQSINTPAVRGQVEDHLGRFVQGALIRVDGLNREAATDRQGRFRLDGLAAGTYQISVSYLGFEDVSTSAVVTASSGQELSIALRPITSAQTIDSMLVVGVRDGQMRALNSQRAADNIKSVLSADYLGRFPDNNVAEAMQRMPGASIQRDQGEGKYVNVRGAPLEYANVSIDGVVLPSPDGGTRAIDLDTIPADVISALELTKAITPSMDADAIAGNINIVTQGALDARGRVLRGNLSGGRNQKGGGDAYRAGITFGDKFGSSENMGFLFSVNHSETNRVTDNVEHSWFQRSDGVFLVEETEFKDYEVKRIRSGVSARFDMRPSDTSHVFLSHNFSRFEDNEFRDTIGISWERHTPESNSTTGVVGRATFDNELRHRTLVNRINSTQLGGSNLFDGVEVDYSIAYSTASQKYPDRDYLIFRERTRPFMAYDFSNPDLPSFQILSPSGQVIREDFNFPAADYNFRRYERRFGEAEDKELAFSVDAKIPAQYGDVFSTFQIGIKGRQKDKFNDEDRKRNAVGAGGPTFAQIAIDKQSLPFGGFYNNGPKFVRNFVDTYSGIYENQNYLVLGPASVTSDYKAAEDTYAVYGMQTLDWAKTRVLWGVRAERTSNSGTANEFDAETGTVTPVSASNGYTEFFPSAHLRHELDTGVILRASYSTALSRPNFVDLVPYFIINDRSTGRGSVDIGNIDLKPTYSHNFDLMAEYYLEPLGLISGGLFYKDLSDPIFKSRSTFAGGEFDGFGMVRPENGKSGSIRGFELNWQQSLDFLPGMWSGLGFIANYTNTSSSADLPFGIGKTDLAGTSKHTYNLALQYDTDRISTQLAYNYRSDYIDAFDTSDPGLNVFWDARSTLDLTASYRVSDNFTAFFEATNLTDTKAVRFQGERARVYEHEQFGRAWQVGVRASF
jgi:TonB-dependent receptor